MYSILAVISTYLAFSHFLLQGFSAQDTDEAHLRIQPEFDRYDITEYLSNEKLLKLQLKCVLTDSSPCDIVGKWLKPRIKGALLGECLKCTEIQKGWLDTWMGVLLNNFPEVYRAAVAKYIDGQGIQVSEEDHKLIQKIFSDEGWAELSARLREVLSKKRNEKLNSKVVTLPGTNQL